jgi:hypothetical protein
MNVYKVGVKARHEFWVLEIEAFNVRELLIELDDYMIDMCIKRYEVTKIIKLNGPAYTTWVYEDVILN